MVPERFFTETVTLEVKNTDATGVGEEIADDPVTLTDLPCRIEEIGSGLSGGVVPTHRIFLLDPGVRVTKGDVARFRTSTAMVTTADTRTAFGTIPTFLVLQCDAYVPPE